VHEAELRFLEEEASDAPAGECAPELGRNEQGEHTVRGEQVHTAFDEGGGEIGLGTEAGAGSGASGAGLPGGGAHDAKLVAQPLAFAGGQRMRADPRRVADDQ